MDPAASHLDPSTQVQQEIVGKLNREFQEKGLNEMTATLQFRQVFVAGAAPWERKDEILKWLSDTAVAHGIQIQLHPPRFAAANGRQMVFFMGK